MILNDREGLVVKLWRVNGSVTYVNYPSYETVSIDVSNYYLASATSPIIVWDLAGVGLPKTAVLQWGGGVIPGYGQSQYVTTLRDVASMLYYTLDIQEDFTNYKYLGLGNYCYRVNGDIEMYNFGELEACLNYVPPVYCDNESLCVPLMTLNNWKSRLIETQDVLGEANA